MTSFELGASAMGMAALFQPSYIRKVQDEPSAGTWRTQKRWQAVETPVAHRMQCYGEASVVTCSRPAA